MNPLYIGNVKLANPVVLAPMAGVSDKPYRVICAEMGAGMVCMEMVSAKGILYKNRNTTKLLETDPSEHPVSLQLFGSDPDIMAKVAADIEHLPFDILDINMGCPVPKIVNNGEGSALMKDPLLAGRIIEAVSKAIHKPVTVKIRKGFDDEHINAVEMAHVAEESGAAAVAVHGRTRQQFYSGRADWDIIAEVKASVGIPVIGNGDITCRADALSMFEKTHCDAVMIGRAARGNPWIFRQITGDVSDKRPGIPEVVDMMLRHARAEIEDKGEYTGIREMRKHASWYLAGYPDSSAMRRDINSINSLAELERLLQEYSDTEG